MTLTVRPITAAAHSTWIDQQASVSFLQLPSWGRIKVDWETESLGWFRGSELVGAAHVLFRPVPKVRNRGLVYIPEGPNIDWYRERLPQVTLSDWLTPLLDTCKRRGAFQIKMGPPLALRRWDAATIKRAMAERVDDPQAASRIGQVQATWHSSKATRVIEELRMMSWTQQSHAGAGFGDVQPRYVFQLPLADRSLEEIFAGFNQLWRRNIRKSEKAGVVVRQGTFSDLATFHPVYVETAKRDGFIPKSLAYFQNMWTELNSGADRTVSLFLAEVDGHCAAGTIMIVVGDHAWYAYGASTTADREVRPSNALQWAMIQSAHERKCRIYDLRGISDTLVPSHPLYGLLKFKVGTGGDVQEYVGEWDLVLRPLWAKAFDIYRSRRG